MNSLSFASNFNRGFTLPKWSHCNCHNNVVFLHNLHYQSENYQTNMIMIFEYNVVDEVIAIAAIKHAMKVWNNWNNWNMWKVDVAQNKIAIASSLHNNKSFTQGPCMHDVQNCHESQGTM